MIRSHFCCCSTESVVLLPPVRANSRLGKALESRSNGRSSRSNSATPKGSSGGVVPLDDVSGSPRAALRDRSMSYGLFLIVAPMLRNKGRPAPSNPMAA